MIDISSFENRQGGGAGAGAREVKSRGNCATTTGRGPEPEAAARATGHAGGVPCITSIQGHAGGRAFISDRGLHSAMRKERVCTSARLRTGTYHRNKERDDAEADSEADALRDLCSRLKYHF